MLFLITIANWTFRCRSIIWKEWLWWHSEFKQSFYLNTTESMRKTLFNQIMKLLCINYSSAYVNHNYELPFLLSTSQFLFSPSFLTLPYILHSTYFSSHLYSPPPTYSSPCLSRNNLQISSWFFPFFSFITQNNHKSQQPQLFHQHSPKYSKNH